MKTKRQRQWSELQAALGSVSQALQEFKDLWNDLDGEFEEMSYEAQERPRGEALCETVEALTGAMDDLERIEALDGEVPWFKDEDRV